MALWNGKTTLGDGMLRPAYRKVTAMREYAVSAA